MVMVVVFSDTVGWVYQGILADRRHARSCDPPQVQLSPAQSSSHDKVPSKNIMLVR